MMKLLAIVFVGFVIAGLLAGKLAVAIIAVAMLPLLCYADRIFTRQDMAWELEQQRVQSTESELERHECMCNFM